jgi:hypothetical protein
LEQKESLKLGKILTILKRTLPQNVIYNSKVQLLERSKGKKMNEEAALGIVGLVLLISIGVCMVVCACW